MYVTIYMCIYISIDIHIYICIFFVIVTDKFIQTCVYLHIERERERERERALPGRTSWCPRRPSGSPSGGSARGPGGQLLDLRRLRWLPLKEDQFDMYTDI